MTIEMHTSAVTRALPAALLALSAAAAAGAQNLGLVADNGGDDVIVFDADSGEAISSISISGQTIGDCLIVPEYQLGFVTNFSRRVYVIDLSLETPALMATISITNPGEDLARSADGRYLVVTDGTSVVPVSVIDIETLREVTAEMIGSDNVAVDVAPDGSVLIASHQSNRVRRFMLGSAGELSDSGEYMSFSRPTNITVAPGGMFAIAVGRASRQFASFSVGGLSQVQQAALPGTGIAAVFNSTGDRLYIRTTAPGQLLCYEFDPLTGAFVEAALFDVPIDVAPAFFGMDQLAMHPDDTRIFVPEGPAVSIFDAETGDYLGETSGMTLQNATGIMVASMSTEPDNQMPAIAFGEPVIFKRNNHKMYDVAGVFAAEDPDGDPLALSFRAYSNEDESEGRHSPDFADRFEDTGELLVRAERRGRRDSGRYYIMVVTADDGRGGEVRTAGIAAMLPRTRSSKVLGRVHDAAMEDLIAIQSILDTGIDFDPETLDLYEQGMSQTETDQHHPHEKWEWLMKLWWRFAR